MAEKIQLEIVTPDRLVLREAVEELQVPGKNGYLGILPGHAPLISELQIGELSYKQEKTVHYLSIVNGYCEVLPDKVVILAEKAEKAEEIDVNRAMTSRQRAEKRLADLSRGEIDFNRAEVSLQRALIRLQVSKHTGSSSQ
jgi:F-type H+-transporting ATPase subunit epsilon